ncbi:MAG TPA: 50S ribosomal protein L25 [Acidimicrobiia bacterium]
MPEVSLRAQTGRSTGSRDSRRVRKTGDVPAIVYGKGTEPVSIAVNAHDLHVVLHTEAGANALINLEIEGGATLLTMARVIERHPFRNEYRHIDFVTVSLDEIVTAEVAIHFEGSPIGVTNGGVFSPQRTPVVIEALPNASPSAIMLDVSEVEIGDSLRIGDLPVIEGVTYTEDPDAVVMSVTTMAAEEVVEPEGELEGEGEEPAEGEQAAEDAQEGESGE